MQSNNIVIKIEDEFLLEQSKTESKKRKIDSELPVELAGVTTEIANLKNELRNSIEFFQNAASEKRNHIDQLKQIVMQLQSKQISILNTNSPYSTLDIDRFVF